MNDFASITTLEFSLFRQEHALRLYPNWMVRYFETLNEKEQWQYFLAYRHVRSQLVCEAYFVDQLKWILKNTSIELEYDLYVQAQLDPDFYPEDVFQPGRFEALDEKYAQRFTAQIRPVLTPPEVPGCSKDDEADRLPF